MDTFLVLYFVFGHFDIVGGEGSTSISPATLHWEAGGFLMPLLCVGPSVQKSHRHVKIVDMSDEQTDH